MLLSDVCLSRTSGLSCHTGLGHHFQGQKVKASKVKVTRPLYSARP